MIDQKLIVPQDKRITRRVLSKYEYTKIVGWRAESITNGAHHDPVPEEIINSPIKIAEYELLHKKLDISVMRPVMRNGKKMYEVFNLFGPNCELEINIL